MEETHVAIIGGGIAGSSLAYFLKEKGIRSKVFEKSRIGSASAYGYRTLFSDVADKYGIPAVAKYRGVAIGFEDDVIGKIDEPTYLIDYAATCRHFLNAAGVYPSCLEVTDVRGDIISAGDKRIRARYVIDASGPSSFLKRRLGLMTPFRYWVARTSVIERESKDFKDLMRDYYYFTFNDDGSLEDIYALDDRIACGIWQYSKEPDHTLLRDGSPLRERLLGDAIEKTSHLIVGPCTPTFPMVKGNIAFIGDSTGMATAATGIPIILESSRMLARAIGIGDIRSYEKEWKRRYLDTAIRHLASRMDRYGNTKLLSRFKRYPSNKDILPILLRHEDVFRKLLRSEGGLSMPREVMRRYPLSHKLSTAGIYLYLKALYALMPAMRRSC